MTGYMAAQALLKTLLLTCTSFGASDVVEGDEDILDRKGFDNCAILYPGALPAYDTAGMVREREYEAVVELYTIYTKAADTFDAFGDLRDAVLAVMDGSPCLSADYFITRITGEGEPSEVYEIINGQRVGPFFVMQRLKVTIQENV